MDLAVTGNRIAEREGVWHTHFTFGRVLALLAEHLRSVQFHAPRMPAAAEEECDFALTHPRIQVHPWPIRVNSQQALRHPFRLLRQYRSLVRSGSVVFLRGGGPLLWTCHWMAALARKPVGHWLVSNPMAALGSAPRGYGAWAERLGRAYVWADCRLTTLGARVSSAWLLANGDEVARVYRSTRTRVIVSTSIRLADLRVREDTCTGPRIRLLYVGYIRPEKGLEYLLQAIPRIRCEKPIELVLVGSTQQFPREYERLLELARQLGIADGVTWAGHVPFGSELFACYDMADVLVLPSLSEGTPRVLVEARARSLPVVSTNVGGIPTSVADGRDGLLVPPRDPEALAGAISRIIADADLRRRIIREGRERVAGMTLERFIDDVLEWITSL